LPLIIAFHGKGQTAQEFERQSEFSKPLLNTLGAIVAFPQGVGKMWTGDPEAPSRKERDDIGFAGALLEHLVTTYCIALERVYIVGFSNGGGLVDLLACDEGVSTRIAAAAIVSGAVYKDKSLRLEKGESLFDVCRPGRVPVPLLEMHGSKDPVIHYDGKSTPDGETWPVEEWVQGWKVRNGCKEGEKPTWEGEVHGGSVKKRTWSCGVGGEKQEVLVHHMIGGFGHGWPSIKRQEDDEKQRFGPVSWNATRDIVDFFGSKSLPSEWRVPGKRVRDEL
jgi:poly(3-hydroxybutyrate) depolymerase